MPTKPRPQTGQFDPQNTAGSGVVFDIRAAFGISRAAMSYRTGISPRTITAAETRGSAMRGENAAQLAAFALQLPVDKRTPAISDFIESQREHYQQLRAIFSASDE